MYFKKEGETIHQGDIFQDFPTITINDFEIDISFFVVLTQACDLEQDYKNRNEEKETDDKKIQSVLVCPAYLSNKFRKGEHLNETGLKMEPHNSPSSWNIIKNNNNLRYHLLKGNFSMKVPELIIDFKHYYTIPIEIVYNCKEHYLCSLDHLFKEDLSQRFAAYLSRVGLPYLIAPKE